MSDEPEITDRFHELKCWPEPFHAMRSGHKSFEFRKDDRGYAVGDMLYIREWRPPTGEAPDGYTGEDDLYLVTFKLAGQFGIPDGFCVLSVVPFGRRAPQPATGGTGPVKITDAMIDAIYAHVTPKDIFTGETEPVRNALIAALRAAGIEVEP